MSYLTYAEALLWKAVGSVSVAFHKSVSLLKKKPKEETPEAIVYPEGIDHVSPGDVELNKFDRISTSFQKVLAICEKSLDIYRKQNDKNLSELETAHLRGKIVQIKAIMALGKEKDSF